MANKKSQKPTRRSLGIVALSDNTEVHVTEPTFGEIVDDYGGALQLNLISKATGLSTEALMALPMSDGLTLMIKTLPLMEKVTTAMQAVDQASIQ